MINIYILTLALGISMHGAQSGADMQAAGISHTTSRTIALKGDPVKRGAPLGASRKVVLNDVLKEPKRFSDSLVTIEGVINSVCPKKGCWMEIAAKKGGKGVRVTFKDYGFFVPLDSKGMKVRAEGRIMVNTLSKEDVEHLVGEGAQIDVNADGTATEVSFVADGVELEKL